MKKEGLKKTSEFKRVFSQGKSRYGKYTIIYIFPGQQEANRVGIIVKKSIGKATQRNRIKRRLREIWRLKGKKIISGSDVIILARKEILGAPFLEIEQEMVRLLERDSKTRIKE